MPLSSPHPGWTDGSADGRQMTDAHRPPAGPMAVVSPVVPGGPAAECGREQDMNADEPAVNTSPEQPGRDSSPEQRPDLAEPDRDARRRPQMVPRSGTGAARRHTAEPTRPAPGRPRSADPGGEPGREIGARVDAGGAGPVPEHAADADASMLQALERARRPMSGPPASTNGGPARICRPDRLRNTPAMPASTTMRPPPTANWRERRVNAANRPPDDPVGGSAGDRLTSPQTVSPITVALTRDSRVGCCVTHAAGVVPEAGCSKRSSSVRLGRPLGGSATPFCDAGEPVPGVHFGTAG